MNNAAAISLSPSLSPSSSIIVEPLTQIYIDMGFKNLKAQIIIPKISGTLSILGSSFIIQDILRNPNKRAQSPYHRIMLGLSTFDIFVTVFNHVLTSWPMPSGYYIMAIGNVYTCDTAGFVGSIGHYGIPLYNCSLATYYLLELKYSWGESRIKDVEKWFHIVPWMTGVVMAIVGLVTQSFGPLLSVCWVTTAYPFHCLDPDSTEPCIRGAHQNITTFLKASFILLQFFSIIYISISMTFIYTHVHSIESKAKRFLFASNKQQIHKRSRWIMIQGILYSAVLILTYIFPMIGIIAYFVTRKAYDWNDFLLSIFFPLQGFFNALIYLIPFYRKKRSEWMKRKKRKEEKEEYGEEEEDGGGGEDHHRRSSSNRRLKSSSRSSKTSRRSSTRFSILGFTKQYKWWEQEFEIIQPSNQNMIVNNRNDDHGDQKVAIESQSKNEYEPSSSELTEITGLSKIMNGSHNDSRISHSHDHHEGGENNVHHGISFPFKEIVEDEYDEYDETIYQNQRNHKEKSKAPLEFNEQPLNHNNDTSNHDLDPFLMSRDEMNDQRINEEEELSYSYYDCQSNPNSSNGLSNDTSSLAIQNKSKGLEECDHDSDSESQVDFSYRSKLYYDEENDSDENFH